MEFKIKFSSNSTYFVVNSPDKEIGLLLLNTARVEKKEDFHVSLMEPRVADLQLHSLTLVVDEKFAESSKRFQHCNVVNVEVDRNFFNKLLVIRLKNRVDTKSGIPTSIFFYYKIFEIDVLEEWKREGYPLYMSENKE